MKISFQFDMYQLNSEACHVITWNIWHLIHHR